MTLSDFALSINWTFGLILDVPDIEIQAVNAARQYCAWGDIADLAITNVLSAGTKLTESEWGIIRPLAALYIERENARALEASRGNGVDVYGRTVSEIDQSITQYETIDMPRAAFFQLPESI